MMIRKTMEFCFCSQFNWFFLFDSFNFVCFFFGSQLNNSFRCFELYGFTMEFHSFIQSNYWIINIGLIRGRENWILSQILLVHSLIIDLKWETISLSDWLSKRWHDRNWSVKCKKKAKTPKSISVHRSSFIVVDKW